MNMRLIRYFIWLRRMRSLFSMLEELDILPFSEYLLEIFIFFLTVKEIHECILNHWIFLQEELLLYW